MLYIEPEPKWLPRRIVQTISARISWIVLLSRRRRGFSDDDLLGMPAYLKRDLGLFDGELGVRSDPRRVRLTV